MNLLLNSIALDPNRWTADKKPLFRLVDLLPGIAGAGFSQVEVWQYHVSHLDAIGLETLAQQGDALGITFPIVGMYPRLHRSGREGARDLTEAMRVLDVALGLGARRVKIFGGSVGSEGLDRAARDRSIGRAREIVARAGELGLSLTAETHPDTLCDSPEAALRFLEEVGASNVALCFQPFDFTSTERTLADYRLLKDYVVHVHLQGRYRGDIVLLEEADIDYAVLIAELAAAGFDGDLCIEFVKGCVVGRPESFDLDRVLASASQDRHFVQALLGQSHTRLGL